jgi:uncharacterized protein
MDFRKIMREFQDKPQNSVHSKISALLLECVRLAAALDYRRPSLAIAALLAATLFLSACKQDDQARNQPATATAAASPVSNPAPTAATPDPSGGRPQPKLQTMKLWIGTNEVIAELAMTVPQIRTGMMWRTNMAEMEGMLFVFAQPQQVAFYMRNTLLPLSCAYIDPEGTILEVYDMKPRDETPIPSKSDQVLYVLEMKQGWFDRHGVRPGVAISSERGPFSQIFRRR